MNTTTFAEKKEEKPEIREINMPEEKADKKLDDRHSLLIMTLLSLMIMFVAVGMIYFYIKKDPDLVHRNDQTTEVSGEDGFVNTESIQKLEHDASKISFESAENSELFIVCGIGLMAVMAGAFIFVKVAESKDDN